MTAPSDGPRAFRSRHNVKADWTGAGWRVELSDGAVNLVPGDTLRLNSDTKLEVVITVGTDGSIVEDFVGPTRFPGRPTCPPGG